MSKLKKVKISQVNIGMFIQEMDISWLKSPFLRHRRKIEKQSDILLLKKSGVRIVTIDLDKGCDISEQDESKIDDSSKEILTDEVGKVSNTLEEENQNAETTAEESSLTQEIKAAKLIQSKIHSLVGELNEKIKNGEAVDISEIKPVIKETIASLQRNDQALLSIIHMHRQDLRLDSHAFGVFGVVLPLALKCRLTADEIEILGMAALLHDCGWSRLPLNLLSKSKKYNDNEQKLVHQHPYIGVNALKISNCVSQDVLQLIGQHHETSIGNGYPKKSTENELHKLHHYLQVADIYDESIHGIGDEPCVLPANALKLLYKKSSDGYFPTQLAVEMIRIMGIYPISTIVKLTTGEIGIVREVNRKLPLLPKVDLILDPNNQIFSSIERIDLTHDDENRLILDILDESFLPDPSII